MTKPVSTDAARIIAEVEKIGETMTRPEALAGMAEAMGIPTCSFCGREFPGCDAVPGHNYRPKVLQPGINVAAYCPGSRAEPEVSLVSIPPEADEIIAQMIGVGEPVPFMPALFTYPTAFGVSFQNTWDENWGRSPLADLIANAEALKGEAWWQGVQDPRPKFMPARQHHDDLPGKVPVRRLVKDIPEGEWAMLVNTASITLNEFRERAGLPPLFTPDGDAPYHPSANAIEIGLDFDEGEEPMGLDDIDPQPISVESPK